MKLALGSLLASLALFVYGFVSFGLLRWHYPKPLKDDTALAAAITASVTEPGVYMVPSMLKPDGSHRTDDEWLTASQTGPYMLAVLRPGGNARPMISLFAASIVYYFLCSLILGIILSRIALSYVCLIRISGMIGLFGSLAGWLQAYNWYEYPPAYWLPYVVDSVIQGVLAGAILGKFVGKKGAPGPA